MLCLKPFVRPSYLPYLLHYLMLCWNHLCKPNYLPLFIQCLVVLSDAMFETIFRPSYLPYFIHYLMLCWNHFCNPNYLPIFMQCLVVLSDATFVCLKPFLDQVISPILYINWCYVETIFAKQIISTFSHNV